MRRFVLLLCSILVLGAVVAAPPASAASGFTFDPPTRVGRIAPGPFDLLSCPSATFCMAFDKDQNVLTFDGTSWQRSAGTAPSAFPDALSCVSASFCMTSDFQGVQRWDGARWTNLGDVGISGPALSCVSASFCVGVGNSQWVRWNGSTWSSPSALAYPAFDVSCVSATSCVASFTQQDDSGRITYGVGRFTGTAWGAATILGRTPSGNRGVFSKISCIPSGFCLYYASGQNATTDAGFARYAMFRSGRWSSLLAAPAPPDDDSSDFDKNPSSVSCAYATRCLVSWYVTAAVASFDGTSWRTSRPLVGTASGFASCPVAQPCRFVSGATMTRRVGTRWDTPTTITRPEFDGFTHVSCTTSTFCAAADDQFALNWNGTSWGPPTRIALGQQDPSEDSSFVTDVSCATPSFCLASVDFISDISRSAETQVWNGSRWSSGPFIDGARPIAVSCVSPTFCVLLAAISGGNAVGAWRYNGSTLTRIKTFGQPVDAVSCVSRTFCVVTGPQGAGSRSSEFTGTTWQPFVPVESSGRVTAVSCRSTSFCVAVDTAGRAITYNGTSWGASVVAAPGALSDVSCPRTGRCAAVGPGTGFASLSAGAWEHTQIPGVSRPAGVSCPSIALCAVVDDHGFATIGRTE